MSSRLLTGNFVSRSIRTNPQGWIVVLVMFLALSMLSATRASIGLAMPSLELEFGWSKGFISTVIAWALIVMAVMSPMIGNLLDKFGPRMILIIGLLITAAGLTATSRIGAGWHFFLSYALVMGIAFGLVSKNVASATIARHFDRDRGFALGIANTGATAGHVALLPVMALILTVAGWRLGYLFLAVVALLLVPFVWFLIKPETAEFREKKARAHAAEGPAMTLGGKLRFLFTNGTFLALLGSYTICGFTATGMIDVHFLPYAIACGIPVVTSATAYGVLATFNLIGMTLAGYMADRYNRPHLLAVIYIMRGLSYILLLMVPVYDVNLIWVFAVVFGVFDYATIPLTASIVATHVGLRIIGLALGVLAMFHAGGGALGAFLGGVLFDAFQKYDWVWIAALTVALLAGLLSLTIREHDDHGKGYRKPESSGANAPPTPARA